MWSSVKRLIKKGLTVRKATVDESRARRVRLLEEEPSDRFVLIIWLMVLFFVGLVFLEVVHMVWIGSWSDVIFNGVMLVVGTIVGAVWGKSAE